MTASDSAESRHGARRAANRPARGGRTPGKVLISGGVSPKVACLHALMVGGEQPVVGHPRVRVWEGACLQGNTALGRAAVINSKDKAAIWVWERYLLSREVFFIYSSEMIHQSASRS